MSLHFFPIIKKPADSDLSEIKSENGLSMNGQVGPSVMLIHGLTGTPHEMRYLANYLNRRGFNVYCPRLANHGEPIHILKNTRWQELYRSVREAFIRIKHQNQGKPVYVAGLCIGALLALLLAEEFGSDVAGISLLATTFEYDGWNMPWYRHLLPLAYYTPLKHFLFFKEESPYGIKNKTIREHVHKFYQNAKLEDLEGVAECGYPFIPVNLMYQHHLMSHVVLKKLSSIDVPVQLIQAEEDEMTSLKNSMIVYNSIRSEIKELVLIENSYHMITVDRERSKVAENMFNFFNRNSKKSSNPVNIDLNGSSLSGNSHPILINNPA